VTGASSMPVPVGASAVSLGAPLVTKVSTRPTVCVTCRFCASFGTLVARSSALALRRKPPRVAGGAPGPLTGLPSASAAALAARLSGVSQRTDMPAWALAMRYVPCCASCTSKVLRYLPVLALRSSTLLPSGAVAVTLSRRIGTWSGKNSWLDTAPSKVTHTSLPLTTACEGMIHCLCAAADSGSSAAIARASRDVRFMDDSLIEGKMRARSRREPERYRAEFAAALRAAGLRGLDWPAEGKLAQFAAADLAHRLDHQGVLAGRKLRQLRVRIVETQFVRAGRARGAGDAVDRHLERAPGSAPPLAQVGQPLGAVAFAGAVR